MNGEYNKIKIKMHMVKMKFMTLFKQSVPSFDLDQQDEH